MRFSMRWVKKGAVNLEMNCGKNGRKFIKDVWETKNDVSDLQKMTCPIYKKCGEVVTAMHDKHICKTKAGCLLCKYFPNKEKVKLLREFKINGRGFFGRKYGKKK